MTRPPIGHIDAATVEAQWTLFSSRGDVAAAVDAAPGHIVSAMEAGFRNGVQVACAHLAARAAAFFS